MDHPENINQQLQLLWISCGTKDPRYEGHVSFVQDLKKYGVNCEFHDAASMDMNEFGENNCEFSQRVIQKYRAN